MDGSGSQDITLDNIARASSFTLSASSIEMNKALTITINRASNNFVHQVFYHFGSKTWQVISGNASTSCSWTVPLSLANEIPNATSGVCTIIVETYKGTVNSNNYIGTTSKTVTLTVPTSIVPTISTVNLVEATAGLASQFGVYVQNHSTIKGTITATGANGSKITNYKTVINGSTYSSNTFTTEILKTSGTNTAKVTVTDSRGRTATKNVTFNVVAYTDPKVSTFNVERNDTTPTTVAVKIKASIKDVNSKNTYSYTIKYKKTSASSYTSKTVTGTTSVDTTVNITGIDENSTYDFRLEVKDYFKTITSAHLLSTSFNLMDFNKSGKGMAIGKASEEDSFEVGMETNFKALVHIKNAINKIVDLLLSPNNITMLNSNSIETVVINNLGFIKLKAPSASANTETTITHNEASFAGNVEVKGLITGKTEKSIWSSSSGKKINGKSGTSLNLTGMPNLTSYVGKKIHFYIKYNVDQLKEYCFEVGSANNAYFIEYVRNFDGNDMWHTLFNIENTLSTTWKVSTIYSYLISNANASNIDLTNYSFYLCDITISE